MARTDHYVGLNKVASELVCATQTVREKGVRTLPDGKEVPFEREVEVPLAMKEVIGYIHGLCSSFDLYRYTFPDGRVYEEYLQLQPWSGGPYHFVALKRVRYFGRIRSERIVRGSLWPESVMEQV